MKKIKAFNFVELLLVMAVLGMIMGLTIPILTSLKDDDDIYRAYMKKANQDVIDLSSMALIKGRIYGISGFHSLKKMDRRLPLITFQDNDSQRLTILFNNVISGTYCNRTENYAKVTDYVKDGCLCKNSDCKEGENTFHNFAPETGTSIGSNPTSETPGIKLPGKVVMMFKSEIIDTDDESIKDKGIPKIYGLVYIDMNGVKSPNTLCKDRYKFALHKNGASMLNCNLELNK